MLKTPTLWPSLPSLFKIFCVPSPVLFHPLLRYFRYYETSKFVSPIERWDLKVICISSTNNFEKKIKKVWKRLRLARLPIFISILFDGTEKKKKKRCHNFITEIFIITKTIPLVRKNHIFYELQVKKTSNVTDFL